MLPEDFHKRDSYINNNILYVFNTDIYEYDMKSAGTSIMAEYDIVSKDTIKMLRSLPKKQRVVKEGKLQRTKEIAVKLSEGFANIRNRFYLQNDLDIGDIISVNKDAIFVTKKCKSLKFGEVSFVEKNHYSSYIRLERLQFYYDGSVCVKGISDAMLKKHENGILAFLSNLFRSIESSEKSAVLKYIRRTITDYKQRKLPIEYYREFNSASVYTTIDSEWTYDDFWDERKEELDISYNLKHVLLPLAIIAV